MISDNNNFYGINLNLVESSLKATYNSLNNSDNNNTINSKENQKIHRVEVYLSQEIFDNLKEERLYNHDDYLKQIEKIFIYRQNKMIHKISRYDGKNLEDFELKGNSNLKNNMIINFESGLTDEEENLLQNFFKEKYEYIVPRRIKEGKIKSNYKRVGQLFFFNSILWDYEYIENNKKEYIKFNRKETVNG